VKESRLARNWTRQSLASRAGVSVASLKRFETSGKASLDLLLKIAHSLGRLDEFEKLLMPERATNLSELEKQTASHGRKRGRR
jgi:transcriptional regulator with XRE-family HTH domain